MLKLKKMLVLGIAAFLTLGIAACGKTSSTSNSGSTGGNSTPSESVKPSELVEHVHTLVDDVAVAATCTENGHEAGIHCTKCDYKEGGAVISATGHILEDDPREEATCTENGHEAGKYCSKCDYKEGGAVISATGHTLEDDPRVEATLINAGHEAGKHCTKCDYKEVGVVIPQLKYQRIDADGKVNPEGTYVLFGFYPQSKVTDEETLKTLNAAVSLTKPTSSNAQGFTSYKYYISSSNETDFMWYKDIDEDNNGSYDYRCVYFDQYRPIFTSNSSSVDNSQQDDNGYKTNNYYFFKYEPIKWRILTESDGKATIFAELILDSQDFNYNVESQTIDGKTIHANNYEHSSIQKWLNDNFYNTAFNDLQKCIINMVVVDNSIASTGDPLNSYVCADTKDKVWLLSYQDVNNSTYGFDGDSDRMKKTSDYAQCQGGVTTETNGAYKGNGFWWLRSPDYEYGHYVRVVYADGYINYDFVNDSGDGVVPALTITL